MARMHSLTLKRRWAVLFGSTVLLIPLSIVIFRQSLLIPLEPLDGSQVPTRSIQPTTSQVDSLDESALSHDAELDFLRSKKGWIWPQERVTGDLAKQILHDYLEVVVGRLEQVAGYSATFRRRERIGESLQPLQTIQMKIRHEPFSVYLKFLEPTAGREALFHHGRYENKLLVHSGGWLSGTLLPRIPIDPQSPIALAENRHPITEAGLLNLARKLLHYRRLDLNDPHAVTVLDRVQEEGAVLWNRSLHLHEHNDGVRPFARVEVLYDPDTTLPRQISSFEWPKAGVTSEPELGEFYRYDDVDFEVALSDRDFDASNDEYAFR